MTRLSERRAAASELRWALIVLSLISAIMIAILAANVIMHVSPPSHIERIDPQGLHLSPEFTESNLGVRVEGGQVVARLVAAQFAFAPHCLVLPAGRPVVLRVTSPDVIHGLLITGTNINTMVVPGYVSQVRTVLRTPGDLLMPCHEFCGLGHSEMTAVVRVVPPEDFHPGPDGRVACAPK